MISCCWHSTGFRTQRSLRIVTMVGRCYYCCQPKFVEEPTSSRWIIAATSTSIQSGNGATDRRICTSSKFTGESLDCSIYNWMPTWVHQCIRQSPHDPFMQNQESNCRSAAVPRRHHHYSPLCCSMAEWHQQLWPFRYRIRNCLMYWAGSHWQCV